MTSHTYYDQRSSPDGFRTQNRSRRSGAAKKTLGRKLRPLWALFAVVALSGIGRYLIVSHPAATALFAPSDSGDLLAALGKLMILPDGARPVMATVTDRTKLSAEPYFENVQNGDRVFFFPTLGEAVIYRPSENKIAGWVPLSAAASPSPAPTSAAAPSPSSAP